jgi:protein SCO1
MLGTPLSTDGSGDPRSPRMTWFRKPPSGWFGIPFLAVLTACALVCHAIEDRGKGPEFSSPKDLRTLIDQDGRPFSFAHLADKTVLVNFIFTSCPMKCPTQTLALLGIQRALPPSMRPRVRFVSVTVDPDRDSASVLKRYATSMGVDLSGWSFVTGTSKDLDRLYRYYGAGVRALNDGQYDHQLGAYLLDAKGRVMQRYTGEIDKPRLLREITEIDALNE